MKMSFKILNSRDRMSTFRLRKSFSAFSRFTCCSVWIVLILDFVLWVDRKSGCQSRDTSGKVTKDLPGLFDSDVVPLPSLPVLVAVLVEDDTIDSCILCSIQHLLLLREERRLAEGVGGGSGGRATRVTGMQGRGTVGAVVHGQRVQDVLFARDGSHGQSRRRHREK